MTKQIQKTNKIMIASIALAIFITLVLNITTISAMVVKSVSTADIYPGEEASVSIRIENTLGEDIEDVSKEKLKFLIFCFYTYKKY